MSGFFPPFSVVASMQETAQKEFDSFQNE